MKAHHVRLATENGKRIGRTSKAKRLAAQPTTEAARLRRALAEIKQEALHAYAGMERQEALLEATLQVACGSDPVLTRAMVRNTIIEGANKHRVALLIRYCEMAEEGTLCA